MVSASDIKKNPTKLLPGDEFVAYNYNGEQVRRPVLKPGDPRCVPTFDTIPIVSFEHIDGTLAQKQAIAAQLKTVCRDIGFFYAKDTGVSDELIAETFKVMEEFFAQPEDVKLEAHWHSTPGCRGYEPFSEARKGTTTVADLRESFTMGDDYLEPEQGYTGAIPADARPQNVWPTRFPRFRAALYAYYAQLMPFARKLLRIFALALDLEETAFDDMYKFPITGMRALHYPSQAPDETNPSLGAHADFSSFTLVCQEPGSAPALEVLNLNGHWVSAPVVPGTFVCNTGDFLEIASNGQFTSTVHRVHNKSGSRRLSLPFFMSPDPNVTVAPLAKFVAEAGEDKFGETHVGDHYTKRILTVRRNHPSSVYVREKAIPMETWDYSFMYGALPVQYVQ